MAQGIIEALRQDHDEVREMFSKLEAATGQARTDLFHELVGELVRHEVAEEEILRPVSKRDAGDAVAQARIKEESEAEELLKEMEKLDPGSAEFAQKLEKLQTEVERPATAEETEEFPKVEQAESAEKLEKMGKAYEAAKAAAPTRQHPSTPNTAAANLLIGPFAAVMDRARDAVREAAKKNAD
ncbi:MAG: hemerythrin domain-containing protein [Acidimicrobiales bacterium]